LTYIYRSDNFNAMEFTSIFSLINPELKEVEDVLESNIKSDIPLVYEISKYLLGSGGKRIRPSVLLLSSGACGLLEDRRKIYAAAALELIHTATLLHDDVVDEAKLRRGKPSSNIVWGNKPTVLVGDFMLARALGLIQSCGNLELVKAVTDASAKLAEGQVLEVMSGNNMTDITEDICFSIIEFKTASLIESCGKIGALLANSGNGAAYALGNYGLNVGIAFQLIDDALDYSSTDEKFGKEVGQDLLERKMTLPLLYSLNRAPSDIRTELIELLGNESLEEPELVKIRDIVEEFKGVEHTKKIASEYVQKAKKLIEPLPVNPYKDSLNLLADYVVEREL